MGRFVGGEAVLKKKSFYNWAGLVVALLIVGVCLLFAIPAALSGNLLFATDIILQRPSQVIVYDKGQTYTFERSDPEFDTLVNTAYQAIGTENGIREYGWSTARFEQARTTGTAVEFVYSEPVKLPGKRIDIADPTRLFFPLDVFGTTNEPDMVFRGDENKYWAVPIRVDTLDPLREAVNKIVRDKQQG